MRGRRTRGQWGEDLAARYLEERGYVIQARNWRCPFGELDLVAQGDGFLCFVEVKLRTNSRFGCGAEGVDRRKQEKLQKTALCYLQACPTELQPRFDVMEVTVGQGRETECIKIRQIEGAF